jgi:hypothetical protein
LDRAHVATGTVITNNQITNYGAGRPETVGIYLDDETSNVVVQNNKISGDGAFALLIHGGNNVNVMGNFFDLTSAKWLGLYQDDVHVGGINYGMGNNVFKNNVIYVQCPAVGPPSLWDYINQSGGTIALPYDSGNSYYYGIALSSNSGTIVDNYPIYQNVCFSLPTGSGSGAAGPFVH